MKEHCPNQLALCVKLTRGNLPAALLLYRIHYWVRYTCDGWKKDDRTWWAQELQLSLRQVDRALFDLALDKLIERKQDWFGRRKILQVKLTQKATDYFSAATTWEAAETFLPPLELEVVAKSGKPSLPKTASLEVAKSGKPSLPKTASLIHKNIHKITLEPTGAQSPSAPCAKGPPGKIKKEDSGESEKNTNTNKIQNVIDAWTQAIKKHHGNAIILGKLRGEPDAKSKGALASILAALASMYGPDHETTDLQGNAENILTCAVENWASFAKSVAIATGKSAPQYPDASCVHDELGLAVQYWQDHWATV